MGNGSRNEKYPYKNISNTKKYTYISGNRGRDEAESKQKRILGGDMSVLVSYPIPDFFLKKSLYPTPFSNWSPYYQFIRDEERIGSDANGQTRWKDHPSGEMGILWYKMGKAGKELMQWRKVEEMSCRETDLCAFLDFSIMMSLLITPSVDILLLLVLFQSDKILIKFFNW